mgnify:CR=1 FL=1
MSVDATLLLLLAVCCWVLLSLQASLWPRWLQLAAPLALVALLLATGDLASHTSMASMSTVPPISTGSMRRCSSPAPHASSQAKPHTRASACAILC